VLTMSAPTTARSQVEDAYAIVTRYATTADNAFRFRRAVNGFDPAEVLSPKDRRRLMRVLVEHWRWSDRQIERHTKWTLSTVARIREDLWLRPCSGENNLIPPPEWTD